MFRTPEGTLAPLSSQHRVLLSHSLETPAPLALQHEVRWSVSEFLTGESIQIDEQEVRFRSVLGPLVLPRDRLLEIESSYPGKILFRERFSDPPRDWRGEGDPQLSSDHSGSAPTSLLLERPGQRLWREIAPPAPKGILTLWFHDSATIKKRLRWSVTLTGADDDRPDIRFVGGWDRSFYTIELAESLEISVMALARRPGWHRLRIQFGPSRLLVTIDDAALVSSFHKGIGRPLAELALSVQSAASSLQPPASSLSRVWIDDVLLTDLAPSIRRMVTDPELLDVLDYRGDQWLGKLAGAQDGKVLLFLGPEQEVSLPWSEVRSLRMPDRPQGGSNWTGEIGEVRLRSGGRFIASLESADPKHWELLHPLLGRLRVPARMIESWSPRVVGQRQELGSRRVHLGVKLAPEFRRPMPDGTTMKVEFEYDPKTKSPKPKAKILDLCLWLSEMEGMSPQTPFSAKLRAGQLRSELWLNSKKFDFLNRYSPDSQLSTLNSQLSLIEVRVPLPLDLLQPGRNLLEIRQVPDRKTNDYDEMEVFSIAIEIGEDK